MRQGQAVTPPSPTARPMAPAAPRGLTHELGGAEDVLELVAGLDLVGDTEVDELDARAGRVLVQKHDVLRLRGADGTAAARARDEATAAARAGRPLTLTLRSKWAMRLECR